MQTQDIAPQFYCNPNFQILNECKMEITHLSLFIFLCFQIFLSLFLFYFLFFFLFAKKIDVLCLHAIIIVVASEAMTPWRFYEVDCNFDNNAFIFLCDVLLILSFFLTPDYSLWLFSNASLSVMVREQVQIMYS